MEAIKTNRFDLNRHTDDG